MRASRTWILSAWRTTLAGPQRDALYNNPDVQRRGLQSDLGSFPVYPVAGISVDYRFF